MMSERRLQNIVQNESEDLLNFLMKKFEPYGFGRLDLDAPTRCAYAATFDPQRQSSFLR